MKKEMSDLEFSFKTIADKHLALDVVLCLDKEHCSVKRAKNILRMAKYIYESCTKLNLDEAYDTANKKKE